MGRLLHTPSSRRDLFEILTFIRKQSRQGAARLRDAIGSTLDMLVDHPLAGEERPALGKQLRSFPVSRYRHYLIFYRPLANGIEVIRVVHGARHLPGQFRSR